MVDTLYLFLFVNFVNSLLTDLQNVDHITNTIIKVKMVSLLRRKTCDIFLPKTDKSVAIFDRGKRKPQNVKRAIKISDIKKPGASIGRLLCTRSLAFEFDEFNSIIIK